MANPCLFVWQDTSGPTTSPVWLHIDMATRTAVQLKSYAKGDPAAGVTCLSDQAMPAACGEGEVAVQLAFAPINPSDVNVCEGVRMNVFPSKG